MSFTPADAEGDVLPRTVEKPLASGYAEEAGALLVVDVNGNFAAAGADPTAVAAVAVGGGGTDTSGFNILARKEFPSGKMQGYWVGNGRKFRARYIGTLPAINGGTYGVVRDTDGLWKVDFGETVNTVVTLVGRQTAAPESQPFVIVTFRSTVVTQI